jgi:hypothetical protein
MGGIRKFTTLNRAGYETRDAKERRDIQKMRKELGMAPLVDITRLCLRCGIAFQTVKQFANFSCSYCNLHVRGENYDY